MQEPSLEAYALADHWVAEDVVFRGSHTNDMWLSLSTWLDILKFEEFEGRRAVACIAQRYLTNAPDQE